MASELALVSAHRVRFPPAQPDHAPPPAQADEAAIIRRHEKEQLRGIALLAFSQRTAAKQVARRVAAAEIDSLSTQAVQEQRATQNALDEAWRGLLANDPWQSCWARWTRPFEDNQASAVPIDCSPEGVVSIVMLHGSPDLIPDRKPVVTAAGNPSLRQRGKTERNDL